MFGQKLSYIVTRKCFVNSAYFNEENVDPKYIVVETTLIEINQHLFILIPHSPFFVHFEINLQCHQILVNTNYPVLLSF